MSNSSQPTLSVQGQICYDNYVTKLNEYNSKNDAISGLGVCLEKQYGQNILPPEGTCDVQYKKKIQEYQNSDEFKKIKTEYDQCIYVNNTKAPTEASTNAPPEDNALSGGAIFGIIIGIILFIYILGGLGLFIVKTKFPLTKERGLGSRTDTFCKMFYFPFSKFLCNN